MVMDIESNVKSYCRSFPGTFARASGAHVYDKKNRRYLDFLSGCGSLNYGHNHPDLRSALVDYIASDGIAMSMDLQTEAKSRFMELFDRLILKPRDLDYRMQFTGPTGANAVEAAIKLARKITGRSKIIAFTNGFHGCSLGALALTGSRHHRSHSAPLLTNVERAPFDGYLGTTGAEADYLDKLLSDPSSGVDLPAAIILETIQGEGGLATASRAWARKIQAIARKHGALVIVDDIQAGCGRSGAFFSFEPLGIDPDLVVMAKGISGFGLPMSLLLMKPDLDLWEPGEHNGTFRGNNHAFVTAARALEVFWSDDSFTRKLSHTILKTHEILADLARPGHIDPVGRGLLVGLRFADPAAAAQAQNRCFEKGLIVETCGPRDEVLKLLPPLTVSDDALEEASAILQTALHGQPVNRPKMVPA